jgi:DNA-binding transcriptional ArsR family regulator
MQVPAVSEEAMDEPSADLIAQRLQAVGQPLRLRLIARLNTGPATVSELTDELHAVQQNVSQHLSILHRAGLVARNKLGTRVYYELIDSSAITMIDAARTSVAEHSRRIGSLASAIEAKTP